MRAPFVVKHLDLLENTDTVNELLARYGVKRAIKKFYV